MAGLFVELGGVQQRLRGNAADIETSAAEGFVLLDHRDLHAELRRADGADIAAGAGADHDEVVGHELLRTIRRYGRDRDRAIDRPRASPDPPKSPFPAPETASPRRRPRGGDVSGAGKGDFGGSGEARGRS